MTITLYGAEVTNAYLRDFLARTDTDTFDLRYKVTRTLDALLWLTVPPTSSECFVCGESHKAGYSDGSVNAEEFHTLICQYDQDRRTIEDMALVLLAELQAIRPDFEDSELEQILKCASARFSVLSDIEASEECEQYSDDTLGETVSEFLTYGIERELPDSHTIIWDGDSGTVSIWQYDIESEV